jgi:predicted dehydrogenase
MAHIEAHLRLGRSRVGALCDRDPARLAEAGKRIGVKRRYGSVAELCADQGLRAVSINTGDRDHVEPFLQALKHRKHVLVEKPLANSSEEVLVMVEAARRADPSLRIAVGYIFPLQLRLRGRPAPVPVGSHRGDLLRGGRLRLQPRLSGPSERSGHGRELVP